MKFAKGGIELVSFCSPNCAGCVVLRARGTPSGRNELVTSLMGLWDLRFDFCQSVYTNFDDANNHKQLEVMIFSYKHDTWQGHQDEKTIVCNVCYY